MPKEQTINDSTTATISDHTPTPPPNTGPGKDPFNATYIIDSQQYTLTNGQDQIPLAESDTTNTLSIWEQAQYGQLSEHGTQDAAVILVQNSGKDSQTYYLAAALEADGTYSGTNAILLGTDLTIQTLEITNNQTIQVTFTNSETIQPTINTYLLIEGILIPKG